MLSITYIPALDNRGRTNIYILDSSLTNPGIDFKIYHTPTKHVIH